MSTTSHIKFGDNLAVTDEGSGVIRVDATAGGGTTALVAEWFGTLPDTPGAGLVFRVPYLAGVSVDFDLERALLRVETPGSTSTVAEVQSSPGGGAFTPTTLVTLTVAASAYEDEDVSALGTVSSGDLFRIEWTSIGTSAADFLIQLEGTEA